MPINHNIWSRVASKNKLPGYPCPYCANGKMKAIKDTMHVREPKFMAIWRDENPEDVDQTSVIERWSATLKCDEATCGEIVNVIGDIAVVEADFIDTDGNHDRGYEDVLRIQAMFPAPPLFRISDNVPRKVKHQLEVAFRMYWTDVSACVSRLRTAVERLLDEQGVPTEKKTKKGKFVRMDLYERIDSFAAGAGAAHTVQMQSLRHIGNLGTHGGDDVDDGDLFDAIDVLEFVLTGIYDTKTINAKANRLRGKKPKP